MPPITKRYITPQIPMVILALPFHIKQEAQITRANLMKLALRGGETILLQSQIPTAQADSGCPTSTQLVKQRGRLQ